MSGIFRSPSRIALRLAMALLVGSAVCFLTACAGTRAYEAGQALIASGQAEKGLEKLEESVRLEPRNAQFRIALISQRASLVNKDIAAGETARLEGRLTDAEQAYRHALVLDPSQPMAIQGLQALVTERRHRMMVAEAESLFKKGSAADLQQALDRLRPVLSENPSQRDASNLKARIEEQQAKNVKSETRLAVGFRKPITLEFRDAPMKSVFEVVAKVSGLNFYFDKEIRPDLRVTILVKNTSIEDAVRLILMTNQLEQRVLNENSILIYPSTPQKLKDYQSLAVRTFYVANADVKAVSNTIKTLLKTKDIVVDERLGILMMRDTPEAIRMAERIVALQDLSDPEVMLEVEILEIKRSRLLNLGVQWPSDLTLAPLQINGSSISASQLANLDWKDVGATISPMVINAQKQDTDSNILANPRIRVRNKEKAKVLIGDRVPVITTTSTSTGFVSESVNYVDVGLKLEVEPNIYLDSEVGIKVNLEVSSLVKEVVSKTGSLSYQIGTRGASTVLRLKDGETQILAGLINDEDRATANKVPGVGELPVVGRLFGSKKDDGSRSEILLSITPRIVRSIKRPDLLSAEFDSGTESSIGTTTLQLSSAETPIKDGGAKAEAAGTPPVANNSPASAAAPAGVPATAPTAALGAMADQAPASRAGNVALSWAAPKQVKSGEQFSAVLRVNSSAVLRGMPVLFGFDSKMLQVVNVQEGDFFRQAKGSTQFSHRVDAAQGKVFVAAVRQNPSGSDVGVNGMGSVLTVTFKALKPGTTRLQLLSASPEPPPAVSVALPIEQSLNVTP